MKIIPPDACFASLWVGYRMDVLDSLGTTAGHVVERENKVQGSTGLS